MSDSTLSRLRRSPGCAPLVLGHRGARHAAPENTHAAFELSRKEGAHGVELDVRLVKTGEIIVLHDPALTRVTGQNDRRNVEQLSLAEARRADVGRGERVPLLSEVLDWAEQHDQLVNVEVKSDVRRRRDLVHGVISLLARHPYAPRGVWLSSFDPRFVWALSRALPTVPSAFLFHTKSPIARAAALVGGATLKRLGVQAVHPEHVLVTEARMQAWRSKSEVVGTWTVNDEARARELAALGVDVIISDRPGAILQAISAPP
ncbi:MAG: glycerophosphoryl diester phosphodiesterase [Polyangiaceae bacterium]|jgi:glycerophosphoryl diester phosphodiesterase|nr:glycerophosphoryl diester phosphodiesterase [Polyangiaceae bacterium]